MAERRMFAKTIIDSDAFLDMPLSAQALYFHLSMRADDEGFINNPNKIQRIVGASNDDMKVLLAKNFIIQFESGVIVIKHWKIHNYIRGDRLVKTVYQEERSMLDVKDNKAYTISSEILENTECQSNVSQVTDICQADDSIGKLLTLPNLPNLSLSSSNSKSNKKNISIDIYKLLDDTDMDIEVKEKIREWLTYKTERKEGYKPQGFKSLLSQIRNKVQEIGIRRVCNSIEVSMANNWVGIHYDTDNDKKSSGSAYIDAIRNRIDVVDTW